VLKQHLEELHRLSAILIERETIDKDQFMRLLEGASEEEVFVDEAPAAPEAEKPKDRRPAPQPKPFPVPGAMMQPPPDPAKP
jgi:cell division protease FtsH